MKTIKKILIWYFLINSIFFMAVSIFPTVVPTLLGAAWSGISFFGYLILVNNNGEAFKNCINE